MHPPPKHEQQPARAPEAQPGLGGFGAKRLGDQQVGASPAGGGANAPRADARGLRRQVLFWAAALLVVALAFAWSILRTDPTPSPLDGVREVRAASGGADARGEPRDEGRLEPAPEPPKPGHDPYAAEHPAFDQGQFERQLEAARPANEPR